MSTGTAAGDFQQVVKERPDDTKALQHLGEFWFIGATTSAKPANTRSPYHYREALNLRPSDAHLDGEIAWNSSHR